MVRLPVAPTTSSLNFKGNVGNSGPAVGVRSSPGIAELPLERSAQRLPMLDSAIGQDSTTSPLGVFTRHTNGGRFSAALLLRFWPLLKAPPLPRPLAEPLPTAERSALPLPALSALPPTGVDASSDDGAFLATSAFCSSTLFESSSTQFECSSTQFECSSTAFEYSSTAFEYSSIAFEGTSAADIDAAFLRNLLSLASTSVRAASRPVTSSCMKTKKRVGPSWINSKPRSLKNSTAGALEPNESQKSSLERSMLRCPNSSGSSTILRRTTARVSRTSSESIWSTAESEAKISPS
mmetsp:Transcript_1625/g.3741  ORF Transcript_1625/g.3741 Transcript_1625/m.3741 type:complete len:294 (-) Transcript_1625:334-1215(-)